MLCSNVCDDIKASMTLEERGGKAYLNTADKEEAFFDAKFLFRPFKWRMNHQDANSIKNTHANETETMTVTDSWWDGEEDEQGRRRRSEGHRTASWTSADPTDSHCHASITHVLLTHHSLLMKTDGDFQISTNRMIKSEAIVATVIITVIHERHRHL